MEEKIIYDSIIIGSGPAGFSVALNLKLHNKNFIWFGTNAMSDKISKAPEIRNYPGFFNISGEEMLRQFLRQKEEMELTITEKMVTSIMPVKEHYMVLAENEVYETKTIAFCTGITQSKTFPGEEALLGQGVSYCATCDGFFYKGKTVAVFADAPRFEKEVQYLSEIAERVLFFPSYVQTSSINAQTINAQAMEAQTINAQAIKTQPMEVQTINAQTMEAQMINSASRVEIIKDRTTGLGSVADKKYLDTKSGIRYEVDGIFVLRNTPSFSSLIKGLEVENGHIVVNRKQETNLRHCYAAGDCTGRPYQYAKAVGEGNVCAHTIMEALD